MYTRILAPLDGSPMAEQVLPYVSLLGKALHSRIELLQVIEPVRPDLVNPDRGIFLDQIMASLCGKGKEYLEQISATMKREGLSVSFAAHEGDAASYVVREAAKDAATLVAMSTHGRSGVTRWLLGSVTDKVLQATTSPMLVVRAKKQEDFTPDVKLTTAIVPLDGSPVAE